MSKYLDKAKEIEHLVKAEDMTYGDYANLCGLLAIAEQLEKINKAWELPRYVIETPEDK